MTRITLINHFFNSILAILCGITNIILLRAGNHRNRLCNASTHTRASSTDSVVVSHKPIDSSLTCKVHIHLGFYQYIPLSSPHLSHRTFYFRMTCDRYMISFPSLRILATSTCTLVTSGHVASETFNLRSAARAVLHAIHHVR